MATELLAVKDVKKSYRGSHVLKGVSFTVSTGSFTAIVGQSGSGKSTLLRCLAGLSKPNHGTILLDGNSLYTMSDRRLSDYRNQTIGIVFQDYRLVPYQSALDNVRVPMIIAGVKKRDQTAKAAAILKAVGLGDYMNKRVDELSGGQQQRVGIARAIVMKPRLLIADEPTGNLDVKTGTEIMRLLRAIQQKMGMTLIMVTHNENLARTADTQLFMQDGIITGVPR